MSTDISPSALAIMTELLIAPLAPHHALSADEFNIDFGDLTVGTPATYGAAAAQTGTWNIIDSLGSSALVNTAGAATGATVTINVGTGFGSDANFDGPHIDLLRDMLWGQSTQPNASDWSLTFIGLPQDTYRVYYYAPAHPMPTGEVRINNVPLSSLPGSNVETSMVNGVNWNVLSNVVPTGGILRITGTNSDSDQFYGLGGIAGLQLVEQQPFPIQPPPPGC